MRQRVDYTEIVRILQEIAALLEIKGDNPFKIRAYRRGAEALAMLGDELIQWVERGQLRRVDGIGEALAAKVEEWLATGQVAYHQQLLQEVPRGLIDVMAVPGIGPKLAHRLYTEIGVRSLDDVRDAIEQGRLLRVRGLGPKAVERIAKGLELLDEMAGRTPIGEALPVGLRLLEAVREVPGVVKAELAGSLRRRAEWVGDIDIVAAAEPSTPVMEHFTTLPDVRDVLEKGPTRASVLLVNGMQADLRVVGLRHFPAALHHFTGSAAHHVALRRWAKARGWHVSEYGLDRIETDETVLPDSEGSLYATLGLAYIPPELREGKHEIEMAQEGTLPDLIELDDIRGDLHTHSTWSDGVADIKTMARHAQALGWEYLAICDHSQSLRIAGGLDAESLKRQGDEIARIQEEVPGIRIFRGIEVDILGDGSLDLPDDSLEPLDFVVASIHSGLNQDRERLTERLCRALAHPLVDAIGHPTGRRIGLRPPYAIDFDRVLEHALQHHKALEINASPGRLDLNDEFAARAKEAGVLLVINTDAHATDELEHMKYGVWVARRAGLEAKQVLNTRSAEDLKRWRCERTG